MALFLLFLGLCSSQRQPSYYCLKSSSGEYSYTNDNSTDYIVEAYIEEDIFENGWYKIHIIGVDGKPDEDLMYCAGYLEGYLHQNGIFNHFTLIKDIKGYDRSKLHDYAPKEISNFMQENLNYVRQSVEAYVDDPYWNEIGLVLKQFDGLVAGYNRKIDETGNETARMNEVDHWFFQSAGDMFDLAEIYPDPLPAKEFREHCSGMVKLTKEYDDIFFSHDAWSDFRELHGELKDMYLPCSCYNAKRMVISTRVGKISSYDDFYMADSGLYVIETTLNNYNEDLYKVVVPQALFTWVRAYHATWVAKNGSDWCTTFIKHNSGTYNNQYVIVDSNKFVRGEKPTKDLLWIIEQFPGLYRMSDVTEQLANDLYFPSVNTPWHEDLYELAGYPELVESMGIYGDYRSGKKGPRYLIMMRDAPRIKTFDDFKNFMRYNNYKRDPYSQGDPAQQILSRYDQRPTADTPYGARNNFGGLDTKVLRLTEARTKLQMHAIATPAHDNGIPIWNFTDYMIKYNSELRHDGLPEAWNFSWTQFGSTNYDVCANPDTSSKDTKESCINRNPLCGWCTYDQVCYPGDKNAPFFDVKCNAGWTFKAEDQPWANATIISVCVISVLFVLMVYLSHFLKIYKEKHL